MNGFLCSLRRIQATASREFFSSMASPAAWVFLVIFVALSGFCTFIVSDLLSQGQADLSAFFNWMPWLFLFVIPALGMPLWSEERRTGTIELVLSFPTTIWELVLGKYLAGLYLLALALLLTLPTPLTVAYLGEPDAGAVICGYLGAFAAGAGFLAVSCFCSALSKSQTASFLLSVMICSFLVFSGWERVTETLRTYLPGFVCRILSECSLMPHYQAFQRGLFDTAELIYCISLAALFLFLAKSALVYSTAGVGSLFAKDTLKDRYTQRALGRLLLSIGGGIYLFFCIVYASGILHLRFDWTGDHAYSLSNEAVSVASRLEKPLTIRFYCSPASSGMPHDLQQYAERVKWLLNELKDVSNGKIHVVNVVPEQDSADEEAALVEGIKPGQNQTGDRFFLGVSVSAGARSYPIPYLSPQRESQLEYEILRLILDVSRPVKPAVGVLSSFPVLGQKGDAQSGKAESPSWYVFGELAKSMKLRVLPADLGEIPPEYSTLIVMHPVNFTKRTLYAIDQFVMRGGRLAVFVDPKSVLAVANSRKDPSFSELVSSDLKLLSAWGIGYDPARMAADLNFKFEWIDRSGMRQTMPAALCMTKDGMNQRNPLTSGLTALRLNFAGVLTKRNPVPGLKYETLLFTTKRSRIVDAASSRELQLAAFPSDDLDGEPLPLAVRIQGRFPSAFPDGAPDAGAVRKQKHQLRSQRDTEIIVVADTDLLTRDTCARLTADEFGQPMLVRASDNIAFVENVMEELNGEISLASLRSRVPMNRPLTVIRDSRRRADMAYKEKVMGLQREYMALQTEVNRLRKTLIAQGGKVSLTDSQRALLNSWSRKEGEFRRQMAEIRQDLRSELDSINMKVRLFNIGMLPLAVVFAGIAWSVCRKISRRPRS